MMKYGSLILLLLAVSALHGQREALLAEISAETCTCLEKADPEEDFEMTMGLCAIQAAAVRAEAVKATLGIDLTDLNQYEQLGELIGETMVADCPVFLQRMLEDMGEDGTDMEPETEGEEELDSWSDIETATATSAPEYGGPENKTFITTALENTNGSGLSKPFLSGTVKEIRQGLNTEVLVKTPDNETHTLYLVSSIDNREWLSKGAKLNFNYRITSRYHAGKDQTLPIWVITKIEK